MMRSNSRVQHLFPEPDGQAFFAEASEPAPSSHRALPLATLAGGEQVVLLEMGGGQALSLRSRDGKVLLEYDVQSGIVRIQGPVQQVSVASAAPSLAIEGVGDLSLVAGGSVNVRSGTGVFLEAGDTPGVASAALRVTPHGLQLAARQLVFAAEVARVCVQRARVRGGELDARWSRAKLDTDRFELAARDMHTRLGSLLQEVEQTLTLKAGRVRQWIRGSLMTRAERSDHVAREGVHIDGKVINLG